MAWLRIVCIFSLFPYALLDIVSYNFIVTYGNIAPDNYLQEAILINGQFPGPEIRVKKHDTLILNVTNYLDHGLTIHYHGIHQKGTPESDGGPHVTQELIPTNGSFLHKTHIGNQSGTYLYHAHTKLDLIWAYGPLIIDDTDVTSMNKAYFYHEERLVIISQCWHDKISNIYNDITTSMDKMGMMPDTDSIFINGRSYGIWNSQNAVPESDGYEIINVEPNKIYRFRVIGFGSDSMLKFVIPQHLLTIIEVDGYLVDPVVTDHLEINSGQRYSVLVKTDKNPDNYIIKSDEIPGPGPDNGIAILHYKGSKDPTHLRKLVRKGKSAEFNLTEWVLPQLHPSTLVHQNLVYKVPAHYDREIIIKSSLKDIDGYAKFTVNDVLYKDPKINFLKQIRNGVNISNHPGVYEIIKGERVQIVFQNEFGDDGVCEQHPWHTHGHTFYIVGEGPDEYNSKTAKPIFDHNIARNKVQFRDVLTIFPNRSDSKTEGGTPCGWVAIRFVADNPGVWMAHCHRIADSIIGMIFILYERF
jgi:L-ascorbate oxidase